MAIIYQNGTAGKVCANPECGWKPLEEFAPRRIIGVSIGDGYKSRCRECFREQSRAERAAKPEQYRESARQYVEANKDHIREIKRAHQKENPEKYDEALRKFRESHREELNAKAKERRDANIEHAREIGRKAYERHAEERRAYSREYAKEHPEKSIAANNRRRARKHEAGGSHTEQEWQDLKAYYDFTCLRCHRREPEIKLSRDHVLPLEMGGSDSVENIQPLCTRCNSKKNNKHIDYR